MRWMYIVHDHIAVKVSVKDRRTNTLQTNRVPLRVLLTGFPGRVARRRLRDAKRELF